MVRNNITNNGQKETITFTLIPNVTHSSFVSPRRKRSVDLSENWIPDPLGTAVSDLGKGWRPRGGLGTGHPLKKHSIPILPKRYTFPCFSLWSCQKSWISPSAAILAMDIPCDCIYNYDTKILEVNLFAFAYRLFHRDFSPINRTYCIFHSTYNMSCWLELNVEWKLNERCNMSCWLERNLYETVCRQMQTN